MRDDDDDEDEGGDVGVDSVFFSVIPNVAPSTSGRDSVTLTRGFSFTANVLTWMSMGSCMKQRATKLALTISGGRNWKNRWKEDEQHERWPCHSIL